MLFIGPPILSGIGQVVLEYSKLLDPSDSHHIVLGQDQYIQNQDVFMFALPTPQWLSVIPTIIKTSKSVRIMTICETETVHEDYGKLFELCPNGEVLVASDFCKKIFERQFSFVKCKILRHTTSIPSPLVDSLSMKQRDQLGIGFVPMKTPDDPYVFYHIGNIIDPRKNINGLLTAFLRCDFGDSAILVIKATCKHQVTLPPGVQNVSIINGLLSKEDLDTKVHNKGHCYVTFSHSEGVGMGAVEAAVRGKPVILPEYGGCKEYVHTPYTVRCTSLIPVGQDDFLFNKEMLWGDHDTDHLVECMKDAFQKRLMWMDHSHTRELVRNVKFN